MIARPSRISLARFLEPLEAAGLDPGRIFGEVLEEVGNWRRADARLEWPLFLRLCSQLLERGADPVDAENSRSQPRCFTREILQRAARSAALESFSLRELYTTELPRIAAQWLPVVDWHSEELESGLIDLNLRLPDAPLRSPDLPANSPAETSPDPSAFLALLQAFLCEMPILKGVAPVQVELDPSDSQASFQITLSAAAADDETRPPAARSSTRANERHEGPSAESLRRSLVEANSLDELARLLLDEICASCGGVSLWISRLDATSKPGEARPHLFRKRGDSVKPPTQSLRMIRFEHEIGRLDLWDPPERGLGSLDFLSEILPWVSLALENIVLRAPADRSQPAAPLPAVSSDDTRFDRSLAESAGNIIIEFSERSHIRYISPSLLEGRRGVDPEELTACLDALVHPDDRSLFERMLEDLWHESRDASLRFRIRDEEHGWRWMEAICRSHLDEAGQRRAIAICRDTTTEIRAREQRDQFLSILQKSPELVLIASVQGHVQFANVAACRELCMDSEGDAPSASLFDFLGPADAERMRFDVLPVVLHNRSWTGRLALRSRHAEHGLSAEATFFLIENAAHDMPPAVAGIFRDTRATRDLEEQLSEIRTRYALLADNPHDLIAEIDTTGRFVYVSPNFEVLLGYPPENLLGTEVFALLLEEDREELRDHFDSSLRDGQPLRAPFRIRHADGSVHWLDGTLRSYRTLHGERMAFGISRDITERRRAADALRQSEERLRQSQKMEAIGRLAGGIAHDFNNLLTAIIGYCDLLLEDIGCDHPGYEDAEEIMKAADRAGGLTRQLLAFSRRQVLQPKVLDLNGLVADIDRMLRRLIGESVELRTLLDGELAPVKADPGQIEQVILNLVVNARDAMPHGGLITLTTSNETIPLPASSSEEDAPPGSWVTLRVSDTGSGMDQAILTRIFEPFFTTKPTGEGTGLGLSTVLGIITQSGGHVRAASEPNVGTTFTIYLPQVEPEIEVDTAPATPVRLRGHETILLVEDSTTVRKLVERTLRRNGYTVLEANSSVAALRFAQRHPATIDLLLTDVILPRMDGLETARQILKLRPETRVIYMSGFTDDALAKHGIRAEDVLLLQKPFTPTSLLTCVRKALATTPVRDDSDPGSPSPQRSSSRKGD